jgi:hypothetical protein
MGSLPHQTPDASAQRFAGEPAVVAFRRPSDEPPSEPDNIALEPQGVDDLPVLLRLPDVHPADTSQAAKETAASSLADKLMWGAAGCLTLVAIALLATGKKAPEKPTETAPPWQPQTAAPSDQWNPAQQSTSQNEVPGSASAQYPSPYQQPYANHPGAQPHRAALQHPHAAGQHAEVERFPSTQPAVPRPRTAEYTAQLPESPRTPTPNTSRTAEAHINGIRGADMSRSQ